MSFLIIYSHGCSHLCLFLFDQLKGSIYHLEKVCEQTFREKNKTCSGLSDQNFLLELEFCRHQNQDKNSRQNQVPTNLIKKWRSKQRARVSLSPLDPLSPFSYNLVQEIQKTGLHWIGDMCSIRLRKCHPFIYVNPTCQCQINLQSVFLLPLLSRFSPIHSGTQQRRADLGMGAQRCAELAQERATRCQHARREPRRSDRQGGHANACGMATFILSRQGITSWRRAMVRRRPSHVCAWLQPTWCGGVTSRFGARRAQRGYVPMSLKSVGPAGQ